MEHNTKIIEHQGKNIIYFDYSNMNEETFKNQMLANGDYVEKNVFDRSLFLINLENTKTTYVIQMLASPEFRKIMKHNLERVKKQAFIGLLTGSYIFAKKIAFRAFFGLFSSRKDEQDEIKKFQKMFEGDNQRDQALVWLVSND